MENQRRSTGSSGCPFLRSIHYCQYDGVSTTNDYVSHPVMVGARTAWAGGVSVRSENFGYFSLKRNWTTRTVFARKLSVKRISNKQRLLDDDYTDRCPGSRPFCIIDHRKWAEDGQIGAIFGAVPASAFILTLCF